MQSLPVQRHSSHQRMTLPKFLSRYVLFSQAKACLPPVLSTRPRSKRVPMSSLLVQPLLVPDQSNFFYIHSLCSPWCLALRCYYYFNKSQLTWTWLSLYTCMTSTWLLPVLRMTFEYKAYMTLTWLLPDLHDICTTMLFWLWNWY